MFHTTTIQTPSIHTYKTSLSFSSIHSLSSKNLFYMRLSLLFFGVSSLFVIVSSLSLGSVGLEKRQVGEIVGGVGDAVGAVGGIVGGVGGVVGEVGGVIGDDIVRRWCFLFWCVSSFLKIALAFVRDSWVIWRIWVDKIQRIDFQ